MMARRTNSRRLWSRTTKSTTRNSGARDSDGILAPVDGPELVFGLVAPIGTDLRAVSEELTKQLETVGYQTEQIHVTDYLKEFPDAFKLKAAPTEDRYRTYMDAGNKLRQRLERADALALLSALAVRNRRAKRPKGSRLVPRTRTVYILNQFKRPEEIDTLRRVYGRGFIQISASCSAEKRIDDLTNRIAKSYYRQKRIEAYRGKALDLIARDDEEEEVHYGQRLRETFALADVVINTDSADKTRHSCQRFIRAFFGDNFCTPSRDEYGMFMAKAASLRSSDLSRQVGAAIISETGEMISLGCNEVPRAGGGAYWEGDTDDYRDFHVGYDSSVRVRREILEDLVRRLKNGRWFSKARQGTEIGALVDQAIGNSGDLKDAQLMDILEFGRIVHAEMTAITEAARLGISVRNATLYCTTFPCHICARHIVASGIARVVYIEPYSKSLAAELYPDSIEVEGRMRRQGPKVRFEPFIGIAPVRFTELFGKGKRKDNQGRPVLWQSTTAKPLLERLVPAYIQIENEVARSVELLLRQANLLPTRRVS